MALFVDLSDDEAEPPQDFQRGKPVWKAGTESVRPRSDSKPSSAAAADKVPVAAPTGPGREDADEAAREPEVIEQELPNRNSMTKALGCYPIIVAITASLDLDSLDSLSRTCREVRAGLLQYRKILMMSSLRCINESVPVDGQQTLLFRARPADLLYMQERRGYNRKSGRCAVDLVSECRRCGTVVCRNCTIKPPSPIVLRERLRRLCRTCTKAPIAELVKPALPPETPILSDAMQSKICQCASTAVWLCRPCGHKIRADDNDYRALWNWRSHYGEVLGGLGTGIGDGDRGVTCGREQACLGAKDCEHETDSDAIDAAVDGYFFSHQHHQPQQQSQQHDYHHQPLSPTHHHGSHSPNHNNYHTNHTHVHHMTHHNTQHLSPAAWGLGDTNTAAAGGSANAVAGAIAIGSPPTPEPIFGGTSSSAGSNGSSRRHTPSPGYARHEIEGIGGVVKTKLVSMVKVGACVPVWEDEREKSKVLSREVTGRLRSWCGWCWRVIPGQKDYERDQQEMGLFLRPSGGHLKSPSSSSLASLSASSSVALSCR